MENHKIGTTVAGSVTFDGVNITTGTVTFTHVVVGIAIGTDTFVPAEMPAVRFLLQQSTTNIDQYGPQTCCCMILLLT